METPQASTAVGELGMFMASLVMSNEPGPMFSPWEEAHFTSGGGLWWSLMFSEKQAR